MAPKAASRRNITCAKDVKVNNLREKVVEPEVTISKLKAQVRHGDEPDLLQRYQLLKQVVIFQQLYAQLTHDGDDAAARVCKNHAQESMAGEAVTANERKELGDQFNLMKAASAEQLATIIDDAAKKAECSEEDIARAQKIKDRLKADQRQLDLSKKGSSKRIRAALGSYLGAQNIGHLAGRPPAYLIWL
ncbi:hypothetical protein Slin14017_G082870 [Septoria linicola]|nr:hypothetical protein Slin14017_G082870 [Septoria linicola]